MISILISSYLLGINPYLPHWKSVEAPACSEIVRDLLEENGVNRNRNRFEKEALTAIERHNDGLLSFAAIELLAERQASRISNDEDWIKWVGWISRYVVEEAIAQNQNCRDL